MNNNNNNNNNNKKKKKKKKKGTPRICSAPRKVKGGRRSCRILFEANKNQGEGRKRRQIWRKIRGREGQKR